jgi:transcriptional regulator with XRE-family HTH domain
MRIKELRTSQKFTQVMLAEQMGVSQSAVAMWETGASLPSADKLPKLARALGCTIDELLSNDADMVEAAPLESQVGS